MEVVVYAALFWVAPILVCCKASEAKGQDVMVTFCASFIFSWIGGLLAVALQKESDPQERLSKFEREQHDLEQQRVEAEMKALGKLPESKGSLSRERKKELEKLLGGKTRR